VRRVEMRDRVVERGDAAVARREECWNEGRGVRGVRSDDCRPYGCRLFTRRHNGAATNVDTSRVHGRGARMFQQRVEGRRVRLDPRQRLGIQREQAMVEERARAVAENRGREARVRNVGAEHVLAPDARTQGERHAIAALAAGPERPGECRTARDGSVGLVGRRERQPDDIDRQRRGIDAVDAHRGGEIGEAHGDRHAAGHAVGPRVRRRGSDQQENAGRCCDASPHIGPFLTEFRTGSTVLRFSGSTVRRLRTSRTGAREPEP